MSDVRFVVKYLRGGVRKGVRHRRSNEDAVISRLRAEAFMDWKTLYRYSVQLVCMKGRPGADVFPRTSESLHCANSYCY